MNIELQVKNLFANASQLDEAEFISDFYYIAKEFARQQNGAKSDVMCCKELLAQMLKEENEALGKVGFYEQYKKETHANQKYCLTIVKQMIEKRQPSA